MRFLFLSFLLFELSFSAVADSAINTYISGSQRELMLLKPIERYLIKAYSKLGYRINFVDLSNARTIKMAKEGELDSLTLRTKEVAERMDNMHMIPVPLVEGEFVLYCQTGVVCNIDTLDSSEVIIGILNGINMTSIYMENRRASVYRITSGDQLSEMFAKKRLDYILTFEIEGLNAFGLDEQHDIEKYVIQKITGYHLVHKKHKDIFDALTTSLQATIEEFGPVANAIEAYLINNGVVNVQ